MSALSCSTVPSANVKRAAKVHTPLGGHIGGVRT
jgi:hypothetical protein